jgi:hypothetical protein
MEELDDRYKSEAVRCMKCRSECEELRDQLGTLGCLQISDQIST